MSNSSIATLTQLGWGVRYVRDFFPQTTPAPEYFSPTSERLHAQPVTQGGRQAAWFVQLPFDQPAVLRYYRRGGLIAQFFHDQYLWLGAERTRSWAEFEVMRYLYEQGVPVPEPIWASWERHFLYYRAALVTARVAGARPLASALNQASPDGVARVVKSMHDAGVYHADLNAFNILLDADEAVWLIDFDRARRFRQLSFAQRKNNLRRLQRSLLKIAGPVGGRWYQRMAQAYKALL
ncbi:MAG TPA: 3-deoxy-D-manno-octulosonic acid kinase [Paenalcaligenes sp.]|nr:3-deoxy-D-manno-octulosonic acid kinase [Paenalcaligenes sp.]